MRAGAAETALQTNGVKPPGPGRSGETRSVRRRPGWRAGAQGHPRGIARGFSGASWLGRPPRNCGVTAADYCRAEVQSERARCMDAGTREPTAGPTSTRRRPVPAGPLRGGVAVSGDPRQPTGWLRGTFAQRFARLRTWWGAGDRLETEWRPSVRRLEPSNGPRHGDAGHAGRRTTISTAKDEPRGAGRPAPVLRCGGWGDQRHRAAARAWRPGRSEQGVRRPARRNAARYAATMMLLDPAPRRGGAAASLGAARPAGHGVARRPCAWAPRDAARTAIALFAAPPTECAAGGRTGGHQTSGGIFRRRSALSDRHANSMGHPGRSGAGAPRLAPLLRGYSSSSVSGLVSVRRTPPRPKEGR
jgi:hypothetical protein